MRFLIHPGFPKSGSSTLQQRVLMKLSGVRYLAGRPFAAEVGPDDAERVGRFYHELAFTEAPDLGAMSEIWRDVFLPRARQDKLNIVSDEHLVFNHRPPVAVAQDLRSIIGEAKILIVIRDQLDLLRSLYDMSPFYARDPKRKYVKFSTWLQTMVSNPDENISGSLKYTDTYDAFANAFGNDHVFMIDMERLFGDGGARDRLCAELDIDAAEFHTVTASGKVGGHENNSYKKITRRLLPAGLANSVLSKQQLSVAKTVLRKVTPASKTKPNDDDRALVDSFFAGHRPDDLAQSSSRAIIV